MQSIRNAKLFRLLGLTIVVAICNMLTLESFSQNPVLYQNDKTNLYGYKKDETHDLIKPKFTYATQFENGIAIVSQDDPQIKAQFQKYIINDQGKKISDNYDHIYENTIQFNILKATVHSKDSTYYQLIYINGRKIKPAVTSRNANSFEIVAPNCFKRNNEFYIVSNIGEIIAKYKSLIPFSEKLLFAKNDSNKYQLITYSNQQYNSDQFTKVMTIDHKDLTCYLNENRKLYYKQFVIVEADSTGSRRQGVLDTLAHLIIPPAFDNINLFKDYFIITRYKKNYGIFDLRGREIIPPKYDSISDFNNVILRTEKNRKTGFVDYQGFVMSEAIYDTLVPVMSYYNFNVFYKVLTGDKWGLIDDKALEIAPTEYDYISDFYPYCNCAKVEKNHKYGFLSDSGYVITPIIYDDVSYYDKRFLAIKETNFWQYINNDAKPILRDSFDLIAPLNMNYDKVRKNYHWYLFDKKIQKLYPNEYDEINPFYENLAAAKLNEKWGYIDTSANIVIPFKYKSVIDFCDNMAIVEMHDTVTSETTIQTINSKGNPSKKLPPKVRYTQSSDKSKFFSVLRIWSSEYDSAFCSIECHEATAWNGTSFAWNMILEKKSSIKGSSVPICDCSRQIPSKYFNESFLSAIDYDRYFFYNMKSNKNCNGMSLLLPYGTYQVKVKAGTKNYSYFVRLENSCCSIEVK